jgi:hypothetical protein
MFTGAAASKDLHENEIQTELHLLEQLFGQIDRRFHRLIFPFPSLLAIVHSVEVAISSVGVDKPRQQSGLRPTWSRPVTA